LVPVCSASGLQGPNLIHGLRPADCRKWPVITFIRLLPMNTVDIEPAPERAGCAFDAIFEAEGIEVVTTGIRVPRMNSIMERWVQTCRHELLDRTLIWNQPHLLHALSEFESIYNQHRPPSLHPAQRSSPAAAPRTNHRHGKSRQPRHPSTRPRGANSFSPRSGRRLLSRSLIRYRTVAPPGNWSAGSGTRGSGRSRASTLRSSH
jgi:hypothetical protein